MVCWIQDSEQKEYKKASDGYYREVSGYAKSGDADALRVAFRAYYVVMVFAPNKSGLLYQSANAI